MSDYVCVCEAHEQIYHFVEKRRVVKKQQAAFSQTSWMAILNSSFNLLLSFSSYPYPTHPSPLLLVRRKERCDMLCQEKLQENLVLFIEGGVLVLMNMFKIVTSFLFRLNLKTLKYRFLNRNDYPRKHLSSKMCSHLSMKAIKVIKLKSSTEKFQSMLTDTIQRKKVTIFCGKNVY